MCYYYFNMNKDVIYIEPEDDITDIITKIENSKEKIVALVPPKKASVFRSVVNIKLIAKSGIAAEKTIVLVTVDPSIIKLAASTKLPVTKNLQTPPKIPTMEDTISEAAKEEIIDGPEDEEDEEETKAEDEKNDEKSAAKEKSELTDEDAEDAVEELKKEDEDKAKNKKSKKSPAKTGNVILDWIKGHKKISIIAGAGVAVFILFLIWAFGIAPAADITVGIQTTSVNFSENVTFTTKPEKENSEDGKFYLETKKVEEKKEVTFEATGQKNNGQKASGELVVYAYFKNKGTIPIEKGSIFTSNGLKFTSNEFVTLSWDGNNMSACENNGKSTIISKGCQISAKAKVTAEKPGTSYNIASNADWSATANVSAYSEKGMSGGTDEIVTVVQQSDIEKAKAQLQSSDEESSKSKLLASISDDDMVIDSSFSQDATDIVSTPAVGEEVKDGTKPTLKATTTASIFVIDKTKMKEFITAKAKIGDDQKVYEMKDPFIENFSGSDDEYSGRLKTSYAVGPKITENDVVEIAKGKGIGDAQHDLKDIDGVVEVKINTSFPWVSSVPGDSNKITVNLEVKDSDQK